MPPARKKGSTLGSSSSTDRHRVLVGRLGRPHGLEGFLGLYTESENLPYFDPHSAVFVGDQPFTIRAFRQGKKGPQVAFEGVDDRPGADRLRGNDVFATRRRALEGEEFWPKDLIGLQVRPGGGEVVAVSQGAAQDRLVIERQDHRFEVPFVEELVPIVDLELGFVEVVEIDGLSSL